MSRHQALLGALLPLGLLGLWELAWHVPSLRLESLSRPAEVAVALQRGLLDGSLLQATRETFEAALLGFAIGAALGVAGGVVLGLMPRVERVVGPSVDAMRPVPSVALIPLALMLFGFGVAMEALVVAFASLWPVLVVTTAAVRGIEPRLLEVARVLEMSTLERTVKVVLPAALGRIAVGLRLALGIAIIVAVTVEIVLNPRGLGHGMMSAQQALRFDQMYAQLLWIGLMGWGVSVLSQKALERWPGALPAGRGAAS
jgi:NitT/TauT family transport system permease protein